jgi:protein-tyrosine phosphatase
MIDLHSHFLPGIDDGAKTIEDSVNILNELASQGVTDVVATPHYVEETIYTSTRQRNWELLHAVRARAAAAGININLHLGNEIYINNNTIELLRAGMISPLGNSIYLLVELSLSGKYPNYEGILDELVRAGYKVVLAHPERYATVQENFEILRPLAEMGVLFQCNLGSIIGQYGKNAKKTVRRMIKENMIFAFGSDIHHTRGTDDILLAQKKLAKYYSETDLNKVLYENPRKIIG